MAEEQNQMKISIIHISDLHRDPKNPISNDTLLNSLIQDVENSKNEDPAIPTPQIIIASGDIIQGTGKDTANPEAVIREQYEQAELFLGELTDKLLGGDRQKLVITPGNHDINFSKVLSALKEVDYASVDENKRGEYARLIWGQQSKFRWSWSDFKLYEIADDRLYEERLIEFIDFYNQFYGGTRVYPNDITQQFDIFDFPDLKLVITAFNSCFQNDPLNRQGAIHPQAFSNACNALRNRKFRGRLRLAVWHHSTKGTPRQDDYMDADFLQQLVNHEYSIGFHGHQHKPEFIDEKFAFGRDRKVNILSASTLAGGERALAPGGFRGYNRVVLDTDKWIGELHVRQMLNQDFLNPIWGKGFLSSQNSLQHFDIQKPRPIDNSAIISQDLPEAEKLLREKKYEEAANILEPLALHNEMAMRLLLDAFINNNNTTGIIRCFPEPITPAEIIAVCNSLWEEDQKDKLKNILFQPTVEKHQDPLVREIRKKFIQRLGQ
jgi:3',5'-cyclic AMP phosphodiesterase CpdA